MAPETSAVIVFCEGCGRGWLDASERWRSYLVAEIERELEFEGPEVAAVFCPGCAEEFGE